MDDVNLDEWPTELKYIRRKWHVKEDVVISGMSGRFPKSENIQEFTQNLFNGVDMVSSSEDRYPAGVHGFPLNCGKVDNLDQFDAEFFKIHEKHAHYLDPQLRKLLEVSYEAIIDAGIDPKSLNGSNTGFYYGSCFQETEMALFEDPYTVPDHQHNYVSIVPQTYGLKGPIGQFDTACGSSFSALNEAFAALKSGLCDRALVAGYNICLVPVVTLEFRDLQMVSFTGKSKSLDESADGYGRSEAVCCIVLQLKPEAKRIYSTVVNCRSNADGYKDQGITFPSVKMQRQLMAETYDEVGVDPIIVDYVEAHTTGTQVGDPVELKAIYDVFCRERSADNPLKIGCLKSNMGHSEAASGLCAMIKANVVFQCGYIPPNIHFHKPNPRIEGLKNGKMIPITEPVVMRGDYISLNCFGFGGANVHVILKGHQDKGTPESYKIATKIPRLVFICGRTRKGIERIQRLLEQEQSSLTCQLLDLLNDYSKTDSRFHRGYTLINQVNGKFSFHNHIANNNKWNESRLVSIILPTHQINFDPLFNHIPVFSNTLDRLARYTQPLGIDLSGLLFDKSNTSLMCEKMVATVASQLILIDLLREIKVPITGFIGTSLGRLTYALAKNSLTEEKVIVAAYLLGYIIDHESLENGQINRLDNQVSKSGLKINHGGHNHKNEDFHDIGDTKLREELNHVLISLERVVGEGTESIQSLTTTLEDQICNLKNSMHLNGLKSYAKTEQHSIFKSIDQKLLNQAIDSLPSNTILINFNTSDVSKYSNSRRNVQFMESTSLDMNKFLHSIGQLYTLDLPIDISCLYQKVNYPVPINTLSLHSLIDFDHSKKFSVFKYPEHFNPFWKSCFVSKVALSNAEDWFFSDHKIDGRIIFPATGMLMQVWDVVARFHGIKLRSSKILFRDVSFMRATVLLDKEIGFKVNYLPYNNSFIVTESNALVAVGKVFMIQNIDQAMENYQLTKLESESKDSQQQSESFSLSREDIYKELRNRGYDYGPSFRCLAEADQYGRDAKVEWKEVSSMALKSGSILEKFHDADFAFLKSWIPFADCMLQLSLLSNRFHRSSFIPTGFETMLIDAEKVITNINAIRESNVHRKTNSPNANENGYQKDIRENEQSNDDNNMQVQDPSENRVLFDVHHDFITRSLISEGLWVRGLKASFASRRPQKVVIETYDFIPFNEVDIIESKYRKQLESYYQICSRYAELIHSKRTSGHDLLEKNELKKLTKDFSDEKDASFALLHHLIHLLELNQQEVDIPSIDQDIIIGRDLSYSSLSRFMRPFIATFLSNHSYCGQMNPSLTIIEYCHAKETYSDAVKSMAEALYVGIVKTSYTVASCELNPEMQTKLSGKANLIVWDAESPLAGDVARADLLIYRNHSGNLSSLRSKIKYLTQAINPEGFLFIVFREDVSQDIEKICSIRQLKAIITDLKASCMNSGDVISMMEDIDWICVSNRLLEAKLLPIRGLLFRKKPDPHLEPKIVHVSPLDYQWIEELKTILKEENKAVPIWLIGDPRYDQGVVGFTRSLGLGGFGARIFCISNRFHDNGIDLRNIDLNNPRLKHILESRLKFNIFDPKYGWGEYSHTEVVEKREVDPRCLTKASDNVQLLVIQPGDLSSIKWCECPVIEKSADSVINVCYAPLNFKDVMFSSARLPLVFEVSARRIKAESMSVRIGLEYSGYDNKGNRVMGMTGFGAMATRYQINSMDFVWPVPEDWSLEDAATVPVVYGTAIYGLIMRGNLKRGESVLIHAGSGGVGIAAIHLCLSYDCTVYTTVGTPEKRKFILERFPQLTEANIGNSRDTSFEEMILRETDGRGVDIVLNSLAGDKLQASLRCLAPGGRFLEIGKYDGFQNSPLDLGLLDQGRSFHGVMMDVLLTKAEDQESNVSVERERLNSLLVEFVESGAIKPLPRTVFTMDCAEDAFRYMAAGKHIGKVVIKIKDPENPNSVSLSSAIKTVEFYPNKAYIIIGGFGGFGLEVALWMAFNGAKHIVINSRSGPKTSYHQYCIDRMVENNVQVVISKHDLTTESGVCELFTSLTAPIGGIFNSTLVMNDALFMDQTEETFAKVCASKVNITYNMDKISREMCPSLDYFVVFSSVASGRGNIGQTNYSLANSYMESVCERRRRDGLHGLAIQWGFIGDVGFVVEKFGNDTDSIRGTAPQRLHSCLAVLERTLNYPNSTISSMVRSEDQDLLPGSSGDIIKSISHILGIKDVYALDPEITLGELGMDSLMAIEVQQALERNFNVSMTTKEIRQLRMRELIILSKKFSSENDNQKTQFSPKSDGELSIDFGEEASTFLEKPITKLNDHSKDIVLVLPPIEGHYQHFGHLFERFEQSVVGLNWTYDLAKFASIEEVASIFVDRISSLTSDSKINMIGYSFGGMLALAITKQLEEHKLSLRVNKLVLFDADPNHLKKAALNFISSQAPSDLESVQEQEFIKGCLKRYSIDTSTIDKLFESASTRDERFNVAKKLSILNGFEPSQAQTIMKINELTLQKGRLISIYEPKILDNCHILHFRPKEDLLVLQNAMDKDFMLGKQLLLDGNHNNFITKNLDVVSMEISNFFREEFI
ncbi:fatty acid synthase-like [Brevipalpus obovatus]|uniref:fatty acid synthase-like n=1 Tax=Brevipalpus obovatus TaxID=246614 RepID=UPI003D9F255F